ncbi:transcription factor MYB48 isoform X2 [Rhodamnia argentea]|uniref:Transcription factor MYB48 isoform X2 n=1 Tax=Rhodamnia argentea TaxID=178133 RepID=A0ABM3HJZ9_9MYRT|nr:transcription factor MYB48 isoform X2 [Rhodamnia argentea]
MVQEEARKGPWTEQEDFQLVCFVGLFGDRRWDFIAKVSGLNRTGKSCRLRWVNYLHPGLKRGKMTPQEERLVLDLHSKWGNRWSRIARKLPGRTDNEIKNYWRTHMRKKAQERKRAPSPSSSSSNISSSPSNNPTVDSLMTQETGKESFYDTGGPGDKSTSTGKNLFIMATVKKAAISLVLSWLHRQGNTAPTLSGRLTKNPRSFSPSISLFLIMSMKELT